MATLSVSSDVTVVVNANRAGGAWTTLSMLLESLDLAGVSEVLVVCRGDGRPPEGVKTVQAPDRGEVTGLLHVASHPDAVKTRWMVYLQDTMVVGQEFAALAASVAAGAAALPSPPVCATLDDGTGLYDVAWLASLGPPAPRSVQDVLDACPEGRRPLDAAVEDMGTFRYPGDTEPPRRIARHPCLDVYRFVS